MSASDSMEQTTTHQQGDEHHNVPMEEEKDEKEESSSNIQVIVLEPNNPVRGLLMSLLEKIAPGGTASSSATVLQSKCCGSCPACLVDTASPLMKAVLFKNQEMVETLIKDGENVNEADSSGVTPLMAAARTNSKKIFDILITAGATIENVDSHGDSALFYAIYNGDHETAEKLINLGADVELRNKTNNTPLYMAVKYEMLETVKLLISKNVNPNIHNSEDLTATSLALATKDNPALALALVNYDRLDIDDVLGKEKFSYLMLAVTFKHNESAKVLIQRGANLNHRSESGYTALHSSTISGNIELAGMLISEGADINQPSNNEVHPIMSIAKTGNVELLKPFLTETLAVNAIDSNGRTALFYSAASGHIAATEMLLNFGFNPNVQDNYGQSVLHLVMDTYAKLFVILACLLNHKDININLVDEDGNTPLHVAALTGNNYAVSLLIDRKADRTIKNNKDQTPLLAALSSGKDNVVSFLSKLDN